MKEGIRGRKAPHHRRLTDHRRLTGLLSNVGMIIIFLGYFLPVVATAGSYTPSIPSDVAGLMIDGQPVPRSMFLQHKSGALYVPFSFIASIPGMKALRDFNDQACRLELGKHVVLLAPGISILMVDGSRVSLRTPPRVVDGELYLPLNPIARALKLHVSPFSTSDQQTRQAEFVRPPTVSVQAPTVSVRAPTESGGGRDDVDEDGTDYSDGADDDDEDGVYGDDEESGDSIFEFGDGDEDTTDYGFGSDDGDDTDYSFSFDDEDDQEASIRVNLFSEFGSQDYDTFRVINRSNRLMFNRFRCYNRGSLIVKSSLGSMANGFLRLDGVYTPVDFYLASFKSNEPVSAIFDQTTTRETNFKIKAVYIDTLARYFTLRIGKQFIKWGSGTFFNPIDVINYKRDPLRPIEEAEGNPFVHFIFPFDVNFSMELLGIVIPDEDGDRTETAGEMPFVPKLSVNMGNFSLFAFSKLQQGAGPVHGTELNCALPVGDYSDLTLFAQGLFKNQSSREEFIFDKQDQTYKPVPLTDSSYRAYLVGSRFQHTFTDLDWLEGMNFALEYYYDNENWSKNSYRNYLKFLEQEEHRFTEVFTAYNIFDRDRQFRNSHKYLFGNLTFRSLFQEDFQVGCSLVLNIDDSSYLMIPDISYTFANQNATTGLKGNFFRGNDDTEFGSYPLEYQIFYYTSFAY